MDMTKLTVNGEAHEVSHGLGDGLTVAGLLGHLGLPTQKIAVERNLEIVPRSAYQKVTLRNGDRIEIVHFVGGG